MASNSNVVGQSETDLKFWYLGMKVLFHQNLKTGLALPSLKQFVSNAENISVMAIEGHLQNFVEIGLRQAGKNDQ